MTMQSEPKVELIAHTPELEVVCVAAAKLCHEPDDFPVGASFTGMTDWLRDHPDHIRRVLELCLDRGESSVIEHASFTFYLEGISRVLSHELVRHRIASYSQQSQRFVKMDEPTFVIPPAIEADPNLAADFKAHMKSGWGLYNELMKHGIVQQDARFVLPNACTTKIVVTMNARSLMNFFNQRCDTHAQWEIRRVATMMLEKALAVAPNIFYQYGICQTCHTATDINSIAPVERHIRCVCEKATVAGAKVK